MHLETGEDGTALQASTMKQGEQTVTDVDKAKNSEEYTNTNDEQPGTVGDYNETTPEPRGESKSKSKESEVQELAYEESADVINTGEPVAAKDEYEKQPTTVSVPDMRIIEKEGGREVVQLSQPELDLEGTVSVRSPKHIES